MGKSFEVDCNWDFVNQAIKVLINQDFNQLRQKNVKMFTASILKTVRATQGAHKDAHVTGSFSN